MNVFATVRSGKAARVLACVGVVFLSAELFSAGVQAAQVSDTPLMDATRELTQDGGPSCGSLLSQAQQQAGAGAVCSCPQGASSVSYPTCTGGAGSLGLSTIGQTSGPTLTNSVTNLPSAPNTSAQPPVSTSATNTGGGSAIPPGVTKFCADGWVDTMGRPFFGEVLGSNLSWNGGPFIPSEAQYDASPIQSGSFSADPGCYNGSFNWIGGANGLSTCVDSAAGQLQPSVQINPAQTISYLAAGPSGNCAQLFQACQADLGNTVLSPNTISTDTTQIGGVDCVSYYGNCQVPALLSQQGTAFLTSSSNPQGVTNGSCQVFSATPSCNDLLSLYQASSPDFVCSCPSQSNTPVCTVRCADIVQAWQVDAGPAAVCGCPSVTGPPVCQPACLGQLGATQKSLGDNYDCSCAPNGGTTTSLSPVQTITPQNAPGGYAAVGWYSTSNFPDANAQWIYGTTSTSAPNGSTEHLTETFSASVTSGTIYVVADDAASVSLNGTVVGSYSDGGTQNGAQAYPSTGGVVSFPVSLRLGSNVLDVTLSNTCLQCGSTGNPSNLLLTLVGPGGQVVTDTSGAWNLVGGAQSSPSCSLNCAGQAQADQLAQPGYVCSCPSGPYALSAPTCAPTCGLLASQKQAQLGSTYQCSCQNPTSTTEAPSCAPVTCGDQLATAQANAGSNYTCYCPGPTNQVTYGGPGNSFTISSSTDQWSLALTSNTQYAASYDSSVYLDASTQTFSGLFNLTGATQVGITGSGNSGVVGSGSQIQANDAPNGSTGQDASGGPLLWDGSNFGGSSINVGNAWGAFTLSPDGPCVDFHYSGSDIGQLCMPGPVSGNALATAPSCQLNCGGIMATNPSYQTNSAQTCSCPSGTASLTTPTCTPNCTPAQWWTDTWAGNTQYVYPMEYFNRIAIEGGHVIQPQDVSGEGYGSGQAVSIPSQNAWVYDQRPGFSDAESGAWFVPLYPSSQDYRNATNASGWVTVFGTGYQSCWGYGGCSFSPNGVEYIVNGYGMNPSVLFQGQALSFGATGLTPGLQGQACGNAYSGSSCYISTATTSSSSCSQVCGGYGVCSYSCTNTYDNLMPSFNTPSTPPTCP